MARRKRPASKRTAVSLPILPAALLALTVAVYWPSLSGDFVWDDDDYVANNATLRSVEGLSDLARPCGHTAVLPARAHDALDRVSALGTEHGRVPDSWMAHTSLGALLGQRGELQQAETHYHEAVRLNPDFSTARVNLGGLLANQGRFEEAIPHMREAARLEPDSLEPLISLGRALLLNGQPEQAAVWLRRAVERWPDDPRASALLDEALRVQGRPPAAR